MSHGGKGGLLYTWHSQRSRFLRGTYGVPNWIILTEDRVRIIHVAVDAHLTLGDIVRVYGPPGGVFVSAESELNRQVVLDYPALGLSVKSEPTYGFSMRPSAGVVSANAAVTFACYYEPASFAEALHVAFGYDSEVADAIERDEQPWHGFGSYNPATAFTGRRR